jgi:pSer/pThr/pTyr-binding forkhead associated (FHA) protein
MATLVLARADGTSENYQLDHDIMTIGRHPDSTVVLWSVSASSQHAALRMKDDGHYYLQDLGSSNGTRVNGVLIEEAQLSDNDQISFGDEAAAFFLVDVAPVTAAAAPVMAMQQEVPVARPAEPLPYRPVQPPMPARPRVRSYKPIDEDGSGCMTVFMVTALFLLAFFLGLTLRHYNKHGTFLLNDLTARLFDGSSKININVQQPTQP